jgi:hypothetical protein
VKFINSEEQPLISLSDTANAKVKGDVDGNIRFYSSDSSINIVSNPSSNQIDIVTAEGSGESMSNFIVDPAGVQADYTTIQGAISAASSGDTVGIKPGVYNEDLALKAGVVITALGGSHKTGAVSIQGKATATDAGKYVIYGCELTADPNTPDHFLEVTGSNSLTVFLEQCRLVANGAIGMSINNANATIEIDRCDGDIATPATRFHNLIVGALKIRRCRFENTGGSTTRSIYGGTSVNGIHYSQINFPISVSAFCNIAGQSSDFDCRAINTTAVVFNSLGDCAFSDSIFNGGNQPAVTVSNSLRLINAVVNSTNPTSAAINGVGTLTYSNIVFDGSATEITTTNTIQEFRGNRDLVGGRVVGNDASLSCRNTDNSNTSSNAFVQVQTGGPSGGDPYVHYSIPGGNAYSWGIDNSETNDPMKLNQGNLGPSSGSTIMQIEHAGDVDFPTGTGYLGLPRGTSAQQPGSPTEGMIRGNTDNNEPEYYTGTAWKSIPLYEEGTFTPTLSFGGSSSGIVYQEQGGSYMRIGNLFWFELNILLSSKGTASGVAEIGGFPSFVSTVVSSDFVVRYERLSFSGNHLVGHLLTGPSPKIRIQRLSSNGSVFNLNNTNFANNSRADTTGVIKIS